MKIIIYKSLILIIIFIFSALFFSYLKMKNETKREKYCFSVKIGEKRSVIEKTLTKTNGSNNMRTSYRLAIDSVCIIRYDKNNKVIKKRHFTY